MSAEAVSTSHGPMRATATIGRWCRAHWLDAAVLGAVLVIATVLRVVRLGTVPRILQGDEANTLQDALRIRAGDSPGIIQFDWAQSPILATYPLAWIIAVFGDSLADARLYSVIFSLLTIAFLYLVARESMGVVPAGAAATLLATNVWFLNFSRTLWYNINAAFFAVIACWAVTRAIKSEGHARWGWWTLTGLIITGSLYGYATGRFICIAVAVVAIIAVVTRIAPARRTLAGLLLSAVIAGALFAPMAKFIFDHYDQFKTRADTVSVFNVRNADGSKKNGWAIAWDNIEHNYRGLIFNDGFRAQRGPYNARYHPPFRAGLEMVGTHLFLAGVIIGAFRWRRTYAWYPFLIPAAIANTFSGDTPDYSRSLPLAPFYFLFMGLVFHEALERRWRWRIGARPVLVAAVLAITAFVSVREVRLYFDWQDDKYTQLARMPGVDHCEYNAWLQLVKAPNFNPAEFETKRLELECSPIVAAMGVYDRAVIYNHLTAPPCEEQQRRSITHQIDPTALSASWGGAEAQRPIHIMYYDILNVYSADPSGGVGCVVYATAQEPAVQTRVKLWNTADANYSISTLTDPTETTNIVAIEPKGTSRGIGGEDLSPVWKTRTDLGDGTAGVVRAQNRDAIHAIDAPSFSPADAPPQVDEPVVAVEIGGEMRIYPLNTLTWHPAVNDTLGGVPILVTFDPIAGAARVYDRRVAERTLTFGVSGLMRNGNALLYDRETETWWQQLTGAAATGELHEAQLSVVPSVVVTLPEALRASPSAVILKPPGEPALRYGFNPYLGYDAPEAKPVFTTRQPDMRLPAMQHVALLSVGGRRFAIPYPPAPAPGVAGNRAFNLTLGNERVALLFDAGLRSPLDANRIDASRAIGSFTAFRSDGAEGAISFDSNARPEKAFYDTSGRAFDVFGRRIDGDDSTRLEPVDVVQGFWFSVAAQYPDVELIDLDASS